MDLFSKSAYECSKLITNAYSTSFSLGVKTLHRKYHSPICAIYGFVRFADEIVDTFHGYDKKKLLDRFRKDTYRAIEEGVSLNPILHSFQQIVNNYQIDHKLIDAFLVSMEMDIAKKDYQHSEYQAYIYGSAEVVGLMCLKVFCGSNEKEYEKLLTPARHLGAAFQKVNFLRDMKSDFDERGRIYFPRVDFKKFSTTDKKYIEEDIKHDFHKALDGVKALHKGARVGVYLAYVYYQTLFKKISGLSPAKIKSERIRIPDFNKMLLLMRCYFCHKLNLIV